MVFFEEYESVPSTSVSVASFSNIHRAYCDCADGQGSHLICENWNGNELIQRGGVQRSRRTRVRECVFAILECLLSELRGEALIRS